MFPEFLQLFNGWIRAVQLILEGPSRCSLLLRGHYLLMYLLAVEHGCRGVCGWSSGTATWYPEPGSPSRAPRSVPVTCRGHASRCLLAAPRALSLDGFALFALVQIAGFANKLSLWSVSNNYFVVWLQYPLSLKYDAIIDVFCHFVSCFAKLNHSFSDSYVKWQYQDDMFHLFSWNCLFCSLYRHIVPAFSVSLCVSSMSQETTHFFGIVVEWR